MTVRLRNSFRTKHKHNAKLQVGCENRENINEWCETAKKIRNFILAPLMFVFCSPMFALVSVPKKNMKISQNLPQFENKKVLFVVSGEQEALFYVLENGEIRAQDQFRIFQSKEQRDRNSTFLRRGKGMIFGSGSVFESQRRKIREGFLKDLGKNINDIFKKQNIGEIFIFCPSQTKGYIQKLLSVSIKEKLKIIIQGNYIESHPFDLIKMIEQNKKRNFVIPFSEDAKKLLDKAVQVGKFWKK